MKKIFTLLAALLVFTGMFAKPVDLKTLSGLTPKATAEGCQKMRTIAANMAINGVVEGEEIGTRSYSDASGRWTFILVKLSTPLCDLLGFTDENGQEVTYTFEQMPFYTVQAIFQFYPNGSDNVTRAGMFILAWPSQYFYTPNGTPEEEIDWSPVPVSTMCSEDNPLHSFIQTGGIANAADDGRIISWAIIPSVIFNLASPYDGKEMFPQNESQIDFNAFDAEEEFINVDVNAPLMTKDGASRANLICKYKGVADRISGFEATVTNRYNFGQVHIYNAGVISSDFLGDDGDNLFLEQFDEVGLLYILAADKDFEVVQVEEGGPFSPSSVGLRPTSDDLENRDYNFMRGFLFVDPKYGTDPTLDPKEISCLYKDAEWLEDEITGEEYLSVTPEPNTFVSGWEDDAWSEVYGLKIVKGAYGYPVISKSRVAWGTVNGFECTLMDNFQAALNIQSADKQIYYHYDMSDINKIRTFDAVGTLPSSVKTVVNPTAAKVMARNGMINIVSEEKAPIAIYTLDGKLVKAANAETLNVEAVKGMYVVRVGNTVKKVVL